MRISINGKKTAESPAVFLRRDPRIISPPREYRITKGGDAVRYRPAALILFLCGLLCACSLTPAPERDLDKLLGCLAGGKISKAEGYVYEGTLNINTKNKYAKSFYTALFSTISYSISGSTVDGDSAEVLVSVTMIDMETLMLDASLETLESTFSGESDDRVRYYKLLVEKIKAGEVSYITNSVVAYMVRDSGRWKVYMSGSGSFADAVTGGMGGLIGY